MVAAGEDSAGVQRGLSHQVSPESAKQALLLQSITVKAATTMGLAPGGTPVEAMLEELEDKQATGLLTATDLVGKREEADNSLSGGCLQRMYGWNVRLCRRSVQGNQRSGLGSSNKTKI